MAEVSIAEVPAPRRNRLEKLEALRGFAATYVFLAHALPEEWVPRIGSIHPLMFATEAVMLFFILSGFVIYYSTFVSGKPFSIGDYAMRRIRRIYPIFFLSLPWAYVHYSYSKGHWVPINWHDLIGNLCMLQDWRQFKPGVWFDTFAGNAPLWSLSYEWWFYTMFVFVILLCSARVSKYAVFALSLAAAVTNQFIPNQICLFVAAFFLWWTGLEMAREFLAFGQVTFKRQAPMLAMMVALCIVWASICLLARHRGEHLSTIIYPLLELRFYVSVLLLLVCGIAWHRLGFVGFDQTLGWFAVVAPISYALYILHVPVVVYAKYFDFIHNVPLRALAYAAAILPICYALEVVFQGWINRTTDRWMKARRASVPQVALQTVPTK